MFERLKDLITAQTATLNFKGCKNKWWVMPLTVFICQINALSAATSYPTSFAPQSIVSASFYGNSAVNDIAVATAGSVTSQLTIYKNDGNGNFTQGAQYDIAGATGVIAATARFSGSANDDIIVATSSSQLYFFRGQGNGAFATAKKVSIPSNPSGQISRSPIGIALGNFTGNGTTTPEIAIASSVDTFVEFFRYNAALDSGTGNIEYIGALTIDIDKLATGIAAGNIDKNTNAGGMASIAITYGNSNQVRVYHNTKTIATPINDLNFATSSADLYTVGAYPTGVIVADINNDGFPAIAVANTMSSNVSILTNTKTVAGTFNPPVNYSVNCGPIALAFLPDGVFTAGANKNSIAVACQAQSVVSLLLNNGTGTFTVGAAQCAGSGPVSITASKNFVVGAAVDSVAVANLTGNTFTYINPVNTTTNCSPLAKTN